MLTHITHRTQSTSESDGSLNSSVKLMVVLVEKRGSHEVLLTGNHECQYHMMGVSVRTRVGTDKEMLPSIKIDLH